MKHFQLYELVDKKTYEEMGENAWDLFTPEILISLDNLREFWQRPITVNNWMAGGQFQFRGYRPSWYQPGVTPGSEHRKGNAFDCDVTGISANMVRQMILDHKDDPLLSGITRMEGNVTWVHFDCGKVPKGKNRIYIFTA